MKCLSCLVLLFVTTGFASADELEDFIARIKSGDDGVRMAARLDAPKWGARAIPALVQVFEGEEREASITAYNALSKIVHHAGRPEGDPKELAGCRTELARLTASERSDATRREALHWISLIGGDAEVPAVVRCVGDPGLQVDEAARLCLERMPGKVATRALMRAIDDATRSRKADYIFSLGKKPAAQTGDFLLRLSSADDVEVRFAAYQALAHSGARVATAAFQKALSSEDDPLRAKLFGEYQRLADNLRDAGHIDEWSRIHLLALEKAPLDHQRERSLQRLCRPGDLSTVPQLLVGLNDLSPRVRDRALSLLESLDGDKVYAQLRDGYEEAVSASKPALLRAMARIGPEAAKDEVDLALASENLELRVTALDIAGKISDRHEEDFLVVAKLVDSRVRASALASYLERAEDRLRVKQNDKALEMFREALKIARESSERRRAITGIIRVGNPAAIDGLTPFLSDPTVSRDATEGYVGFAIALAKQGKIDDAERYLKTIVEGSFPLDLVVRSAAVLKSVGRDPQRAILAEGYILDWWLVGPIQDLGAGMKTAYFPEKEIRLTTMERIGPRRFRWKKLQRLSLTGRVDLTLEFRRSQNVVAYAYTQITSPKDQEIGLHLEGDDGIVCWLNDKIVASDPEGRGGGKTHVKVTLAKGSNRLLLKLGQKEGPWRFAARTLTVDGKALDFSGDK